MILIYARKTRLQPYRAIDYLAPMKTDPRLTPLAASLPATVPFVGPETQERARGTAFTARLGANELGFGPSPKAISAMQDASKDAWMYADPENHDLRQALAAHHGCNPANIAIDAGIDTLLGLLVRLMVEQGTGVVTSAGAYPTFNYHVAGFGGHLHTVPYTADHEDPDRLIAEAVRTNAKLIYIANPDNPMGSYHSGATIERMVQAVPDDSLLILDEAYIECAPADAIPEISPDDPRVIRMRTFSKAYGLAGARVGYAIAHPALVDAFNRVRNHFGMNRISQAAALAALQDQAHLHKTLTNIAKSREQIAAIAAENGMNALPSATNFVTVDTGHDEHYAKALVSALSAEGIFVRMPFVAPQSRCIRISTGPQADMDALSTALPSALRGLATTS